MIWPYQQHPITSITVPHSGTRNERPHSISYWIKRYRRIKNMMDKVEFNNPSPIARTRQEKVVENTYVV